MSCYVIPVMLAIFDFWYKIAPAVNRVHLKYAMQWMHPYSFIFPDLFCFSVFCRTLSLFWAKFTLVYLNIMYSVGLRKLTWYTILLFLGLNTDEWSCCIAFTSKWVLRQRLICIDSLEWTIPRGDVWKRPRVFVCPWTMVLRSINDVDSGLYVRTI